MSLTHARTHARTHVRTYAFTHFNTCSNESNACSEELNFDKKI